MGDAVSKRMKPPPLLFPVAGLCVLLACVAMPPSARSDGAPLPDLGSAIRVESGLAHDAVQTVRAQRAGTLVALFVKVGDTVAKDQVLGHLDLSQARLNLETSKANLEGTGTLDQMFWQHQAAITARKEVELAVRKRTAAKSRLEHAVNMENYAEGQYQAQRDLKAVQRIHYEHYRREYENCFLRSPIEGTVKEVKVAVGQGVGVAAHVFTISNGSKVEVLVTVPVAAAEAALRAGRLPMRPKAGGATVWANVAGVDPPPEPNAPTRTLRLLADRSDAEAGGPGGAVPTAFDVMVPRGS